MFSDSQQNGLSCAASPRPRVPASQYDAVIVGGGPAGASAAIHLAMRGARVLLAEQKKFPREKLCGEFISPECSLHFERLGVIDRMLAASPARLNETVFYARTGKSVCVPSAWFGANGSALGLSRAEMDERLLRRAGEAGVTVLENAQVVDLVFEKEDVRGVGLKSAGNQISYRAPARLTPQDVLAHLLVAWGRTGRNRTVLR